VTLVDAFWMQLYWRLIAHQLPDVFNPWSDADPNDVDGPAAPLLRLDRLHAYLQLRENADVLLIGEAPGYRGCHFSGIPFTSERLLVGGSIPGLQWQGQRITTFDRPIAEASATTVWGVLHSLGAASRVVLWNAMAWHPHKPGALLSNRTPSREEVAGSADVLKTVISMFPEARVVACGAVAARSLSDLGVRCAELRDVRNRSLDYAPDTSARQSGMAPWRHRPDRGVASLRL
jgi:uracil-DNA glycosylase